MTGYEAFCLYSSLKLHFTQESYDYFKYGGKSRTSIDAFENKKDKWFYYKLSRRFSNDEQARDFLVANLVHSSDVWIGHLLTDDCDVHYRARQKVIQSLSYTFTNEIAPLMNQENPNDSLVMRDESPYPLLLSMLLYGEVSIETVCILNSIMKFLPMWDKKITDTIHYPSVSLKIKKYTPFIPFDPTKYKLILKKQLHENSENNATVS
jgi:hypothetical protein